MKTPAARTIGTLLMAAWCIVLAHANFDEIWPYQLSRWALCIGAVLLVREFGFKTWRGILALSIAVAFNPVSPIEFDDAWPMVDYIAAAALVALAPIGWASLVGRFLKWFFTDANGDWGFEGLAWRYAGLCFALFIIGGYTAKHIRRERQKAAAEQREQQRLDQMDPINRWLEVNKLR